MVVLLHVMPVFLHCCAACFHLSAGSISVLLNGNFVCDGDILFDRTVKRISRLFMEHHLCMLTQQSSPQGLDQYIAGPYSTSDKALLLSDRAAGWSARSS